MASKPAADGGVGPGGDFHGKSAVVTGASGIGAATARALGASGCRLVLVDKSEEALERTARGIDGLVTVAGDLREEDTAGLVVERALSSFGRLDLLVNVAGLSGRRFGDGPVHEATAEGWDEVMANNARSTFLMCRAALGPMMEQRSGAIVNTASVLAYAPNARHFATHAYAASKGAILSLTRSLAGYYARFGIRVNAVAPGLIATPMSERAQQAPEILEYLQSRQPLTGAPGEPEDVAQAILYLASEEARFVTGTTVEVAGGWGVSG